MGIDDLLEGLGRLHASATELQQIHYDSAEQDVFDDEAKGFIRKHFGDKEAVGMHNALMGPVRVWAVSGSQHQADRARALEAAKKRLTVLEARIQRGEYEAPKEDSVPTEPRPSVFIAHSGEPPALSRLVRFVQALGVEPMIAEWLPFQGRQVPDQARHVMKDCSAAIVFATIADREAAKPGSGALIETGLLQERFQDKVVYLVEEGAKFGPMADGFAHEAFTQDNLEAAFYRIVVEFKVHGLI